VKKFEIKDLNPEILINTIQDILESNKESNTFVDSVSDYYARRGSITPRQRVRLLEIWIESLL